MKKIIGICGMLLVVSILLAQESKTKTGVKLEIEKVRYLLKIGQEHADTYSQKCAEATSVRFVTELQATWNEGRINRLQCLNKKIEGYLVLGDEVQTFSSGLLRKYQYTLDWGVKVTLWFFNNQREVIGIYSDKNNTLKFRIPNLAESQLIIEEAIIPSMERISVYSKYHYPEFLIEEYYLENHSAEGWPLRDFVALLFNSRQGRIDFIDFLREKRKERR